MGPDTVAQLEIRNREHREMQVTISALAHENRRLKAENAALKVRVFSLERQLYPLYTVTLNTEEP